MFIGMSIQYQGVIPEDPHGDVEFHNMNRAINLENEEMYPELKDNQGFFKTIINKVKRTLLPQKENSTSKHTNPYYQIFHNVESMAGGFYQCAQCHLKLFHYTTLKKRTGLVSDFTKTSPMVSLKKPFTTVNERVPAICAN
jgi:hypothetical protein